LEAECSGAPAIRRAALTRFCKLVAEPGIQQGRVALAIDSVVAILTTKDKVCFDPFAGGGSIPVEARRLGLHSIAGEYNPLALDQLRRRWNGEIVLTLTVFRLWVASSAKPSLPRRKLS